MDTAEADFVFAPRPAEFASGEPPCGLCDATLSPGSICQSCAHDLLGLALGDEVRDAPPLPDPAAPDLSQQVYEHFTVCRRPDGSLWELGRGAMGITYRAFDTNLLCPVTLKIINGALTGNPDARGRFLREARSAARLRHPHVATILHLGQSGGECFYAMEFIEGETLEALLARHAAGLPLESSLEIVTQTARALAAAHAETLVHRDIKPANIMLSRHGASGEDLHVKVIDFGLAKLAAEDHPAWGDWYFAGTPHYASPEQLAGGPVDARSDVYSLGVILWRALAGEVAFAEAVARTENATPPTPPPTWLAGLPIPVRVLLESMLHPDPARRPADGSELLTPCLRCQANLSLGFSEAAARSLKADEADVRSHVPKTLRRRLAMVATIVFIFAAGLALLSMKEDRLTGIARWSDSARHADAMEKFEKGRALLQKNTRADTEEAVAALRDAARLDPTWMEAHAALSWAYVLRGNRFGKSDDDFDLALASAQRAVALAPQASESHLALGSVQTARGTQWEALSELHRAIELNPREVQAMAAFGLQWIMLGQPEKALPWLLACAKEVPQARYHAAVLDAYIDLCADEQAERCGIECEAMDPSRLNIYRQMLHLHLLEGEFTRAHKDFLDGAAVNPDDPRLHTLAAQLELYSGNLPQAEVIFRRLHDSGYRVPLTYYGSMSYPSILCYLSYKAGRKAGGDVFLKEAQALHDGGSDGPQATYDLAAVRCLEGHPDEGMALLRRSVAAGWLDYRSTLLDPRFETLRPRRDFTLLIDGLRAKVAAMRVEAFARAQAPLRIADYPVTVPP